MRKTQKGDIIIKVEDIRTICNPGTGAMGYGTALTFAMAGYDVRMYGRSDASVERGFKNIRNALGTLKENGLIGDSDAADILGRIKGMTELARAAEDADFVIESVAEDLDVKQDLYARLDRFCPAHTVFASDTSGLSPTAIAEAVSRKDKFIVAHFWNPPHLLPLVEVVPGKHTGSDTIAVTMQLMERIGKKPIALLRDAPGFIGNRLQLALLREAQYIVEQGIATKEAVDAAVRYSMGRRLGVTGPLESADLGGLDVFYKISQYLMPDLCASQDVSAMIADPVSRGALGAKTGSGFYEWTPAALAGIRKKREEILIDWLKKDRQLQYDNSITGEITG